MAKVTGIGGVFFKSTRDNAALAAWYRKHLGMALEDFGGAILRWPDDKADDQGLTVWHVAGKDSQWFSPSKSSFIRSTTASTTSASCWSSCVRRVWKSSEGPESHENGKFAWIMDPDENKVELLGAEGSGTPRTRVPGECRHPSARSETSCRLPRDAAAARFARKKTVRAVVRCCMIPGMGGLTRFAAVAARGRGSLGVQGRRGRRLQLRLACFGPARLRRQPAFATPPSG